jgi:hypothetical protein
MTSYPISGPPITAVNEVIALHRTQGLMRSPFTGTSVIVDTFAEWTIQLAFPPVTVATSKIFNAWRDSLRGGLGTFLYHPHAASLPISGKTLSGVAYAYSNDITIGGWSGSQPSLLGVGEFLSIANNLHRIIACPPSATSGICTISIEPSIRVDIASGTAVNFTAPTGVFRLVDSGNNGAAGYATSPDYVTLDPVSAVTAL